MATYVRPVYGAFEKGEADATKRTEMFEVGTAEPQTITVSKAGAAFAGSAGSGAVQVDGTIYRLVIHPNDLNTVGAVAFKCLGATDTQYLLGWRVVEHDPFDDIADILDDTGTSGVVLAANSVSAAALKTDAVDEIVDALWEELVDDHDGVAGSFAELLRIVKQAAVGKIVTDSTAKTAKIYDADGLTLLVTFTFTEAGINITRTPS